jgi:hypothetical protein
MKSGAFHDRVCKGLERRGRLRIAGGGNDLPRERGQIDDLRWLPEPAIDRIDVIDDLGSISASPVGAGKDCYTQRRLAAGNTSGCRANQQKHVLVASSSLTLFTPDRHSEHALK